MCLQSHLGGSSAAVLPIASPSRRPPSTKGSTAENPTLAPETKKAGASTSAPRALSPPSTGAIRPASGALTSPSSSASKDELLLRRRLPSPSPASASAPRAPTTVRRCDIRPAYDAVSVRARARPRTQESSIAGAASRSGPRRPPPPHLQGGKKKQTCRYLKPQPLHPSSLKKRKILPF